MAYLVIAYPELLQSDLEKIQNFRSRNDELYFDLVMPHFTLVFPVNGFDEKEFIAEAEKHASGAEKINFSIHHAVVNMDPLSNYYQCFLVPVENAAFTHLHKKMYSGIFKKHLKTEIPYVPHITAGNSLNEQICMRMMDEWNSKSATIHGSVNYLNIIGYEDNSVREICRLPLA